MNTAVFHYLDAQRQQEVARERAYSAPLLEWRDAEPVEPPVPGFLDRLLARLLRPRRAGAPVLN
jgi:hypothetical protein